MKPNDNPQVLYKEDTVALRLEQLTEIIDKIPLCINVLNENADSIDCNAFTLNLYDLNSKQDYTENFYNLTPENQPDGKNSKQGFYDCVQHALKNGENSFNWLDVKLNGEEIPLYITLYRLDVKGENNERLLVSIMHDLRPQFAGEESDASIDDYYHNRITYRDLFNTVAELTEEWFWVYDNCMSTIQFFGKGRDILGLSAKKQPFPNYVVDSGMVYSDDLDTFLQFNQNLKTGVVKPVEVRFIQPSGITRYYRIIYKTVFDKDGKPRFSIGKTYDINKQKKLEVLSKTDLLTNCLNKITTEDTVKNIIESAPTSSHALYLIDVDDFKSVNDKLGHYFGDIALSDIAKNLHSNFRGADIIGRIGGDEFLVFVKDIADKNVINGKAKSIADAFQNSYCGENSDYKISGSIGVALYPQHGSSYEELYKCADKALYSSKMAGKDRYTIYSQDIANSGTKKLTVLENANKPANSFFDAGVVSAVFDLMYQPDDPKTSMNMVVRLVGSQLNTDRCYVAQTFDSGSSYSITNEWVSSKGTAMQSSFQNVSVTKIKEMFVELEKSGIMFSNSPASLQDSDETSNSFLLTQTKGKGHTRLIFGLEDNNSHRVFSEKEVNTVQYVLKMISIFLSSQGMK